MMKINLLFNEKIKSSVLILNSSFILYIFICSLESVSEKPDCISFDYYSLYANAS